MASGEISGFFRKNKKGEALRNLANVENLNRVANILNDISGEGCTIDKPMDGAPWVIRFDGTNSDNEPKQMPTAIDVGGLNANQTIYNATNNRLEPSNVQITVNGIAVTSTEVDTSHLSWTCTAGLKNLYVYQSYILIQKDANGQYSTTPNYWWTCTNQGGDYLLNANLLATVPWCRVSIPQVGEPPQIQPLLECPLHLYCYRGDDEGRSFPHSYVLAMRNALKQTSKTTETPNGALPLKVHNINAAATSFENEYPNGRYKIEDGEVEWLEPDSTAVAKNDAKALLLRYIDVGSMVNTGQPYWVNYRQFITACASFVEEYTQEVIDNTHSELYQALHDIWAELWNEIAGEWIEQVPDDIGVAIVNRQGQWVSIADTGLFASLADYLLAVALLEELTERADAVEGAIDSALSDKQEAEDLLEDLEDGYSELHDFSTDISNLDGDLSGAWGDAENLADDFSSLDARITALENQWINQQ
jgi:hypothetical protein